jgi:hypothetical protein
VRGVCSLLCMQLSGRGSILLGWLYIAGLARSCWAGSMLLCGIQSWACVGILHTRGSMCVQGDEDANAAVHHA